MIKPDGHAYTALIDFTYDRSFGAPPVEIKAGTVVVPNFMDVKLMQEQGKISREPAAIPRPPRPA